MFKYDPSFKVDVKLSGKFATWHTPEGQVERFSYPYPTMSGIEGAIRSIFWKPEIEWVIRSIGVLSPVKRYEYTTNEVTSALSKARRDTTPIDASKHHTQRHNNVLLDVAYKVVVSPLLVGEGVKFQPDKYTCQLRNRVERGMCYRTPFLGKREFKADFEPCTGDESPIDVTETLRWWHIGWDDSMKQRVPRFANLQIIKGVIEFNLEHHKMISKYLETPKVAPSLVF